jgi:hypothetical protein
MGAGTSTKSGGAGVRNRREQRRQALVLEMILARPKIHAQRLLSTFIFAVASLATRAPWAQPAASPDRVLSEQQRRDAYERGHDAVAAGNFAEAHRIFAELWADRKTYDVAGFLGQVELELHRYRDAAEHIAFSIQHWPPRENLDTLANVKAGLEQARREVATITLEVEPRTAEIIVDGRSLGRATDLSPQIFLEPGRHTIEAKLESHTDAVRTIEPPRGSDLIVELVLGAATGQASLPASEPKGVGHRRSLESPQPASDAFDATPAWVLGGVGLAGFAAGVGFTLKANAAQDDIDRLFAAVGEGGCGTAAAPPQCVELREAAESKDSATNLSYVMYSLGAVSIAAAVTYLVWPRKPRPSVGVTWLPRSGAFTTLHTAF